MGNDGVGRTAVAVAVVGWGAWLLATEERREDVVWAWGGSSAEDEGRGGSEDWGVEKHGDFDYYWAWRTSEQEQSRAERGIRCEEYANAKRTW